MRPQTGITSREKEYVLSGSKQKTYSFVRHTQGDSSNQTSNISSNNNSNTILPPSNKNKLGTSIQSISQYARNSYGRQIGDRNKDK